MQGIVDFNTLGEINQLLKNKGIDYSVHTVGGCSCAGLQLRQNGQSHNPEEIVEIINDYLASKWLKVTLSNESQLILQVTSKFDKS